MENEFSVAENGEMPGVKGALVAILVLAHGVMISGWASSMHGAGLGERF